MQSDFQEPVIEYCEPKQVIDICSYNHYPVIDKENEGQKQQNIDNDIYDISELELLNFPLEQFSDAGKVANEGDPHLKIAADTKLYNLEERAIQIYHSLIIVIKIPGKILMKMPAESLKNMPAKT